MEWNKKFCIAAYFLLSSFFGFGQMDQNKYLVFFTDKDNSLYSIENPEEFLSTRAIERRSNQGIEIDEVDLPVNATYIQAIDNVEEVEVIGVSKWLNAVLIKTDNPDVLPDLELITGVEHWEISRSFNIDISFKFEKITAAKSNEEYGLAFNQIDMLNGIPLHEDGFKGEGMLIGVLDAGFSNIQDATVLDSLFENNRIVAMRNIVDQSSNIFQNGNHGTYVLSTMAGNSPGQYMGTAPQASYLLCTTENTSIESRVEEIYWIMGAEYADSAGVDIINTSLGYTVFDEGEADFSYADMDGNTTYISRASNIAASRGILMVTSAGNEGNKPWYYISAPADAESVLTVGAVNANQEVAAFSSRGPTSDGRIKPNVMAQGAGAVVTNLSDGVMTANGTSFSSPIMAGMAACLWQSIPQATATQVFEAIEKSAHLFESPNDSMGFGIPDFEIARTILATIVGVEKLELPDKKEVITFYPNPYRAGSIQCSIKNQISFPIDFAIFSSTGRQLTAQSKIQSINMLESRIAYALNSAAAGMYVILMRDRNKKVFTAKIIKA